MRILYLVFVVSALVLLGGSSVDGAGNPIETEVSLSNVRVVRNRKTGGASLDLTIRLRLVNKSKGTLLLLKDIDGLETPIITGFTIWEYDFSDPLVSDSFGESLGKSEHWRELAQQLNKNFPDPAAVRRLQAGEGLELERRLRVELATESTKDSYFPRRESIDGLKSRRHLKIVFSLRIWSENLGVNSGVRDFKNQLRRKWQNYGTLVTEGLTMEPIPLELAQAAYTDSDDAR